jgi:hypothetical protein
MRRNRPKKLVLTKETLLGLDVLGQVRGAAWSDADECPSARNSDCTDCAPAGGGGGGGYNPSRDGNCWWTDGCIYKI